MSMIFGIFRVDGQPIQTGDLEALAAAHEQFVTDEKGAWTDGCIALGQYTRYLMPETYDEHAPLTRDGLVLVYDGFIANRDDVFTELAVPHDERPTMSDGTLILKAYQKWGLDAAVHLIGEFAFALWDTHEHRLYCGRDATGSRPFVYYFHNNLFVFSSDLHALFSVPDTAIEPDDDVVLALLNMNTQRYNAHLTVFKGVRRLPFSSAMTVSEAGVRLWRYWEPPLDQRLKFASDDEYAQRLFELMNRSVRDRLRAGVKVGSHLSGGLDSSSVSIIAARMLKEQGKPPLDTYSWSPPVGKNPPPNSEVYRIEQFRQREPINHHYAPYLLPSSTSKPPRYAELMLLDTGVLEQTSAAGIRLFLSGWGGDEYTSYNGRGHRATLFRQLKWRTLLFDTLPWNKFPHGTLNNLALLWRDCIVANMPGSLYLRFGLPNERITAQKPGLYLKPDFAARLNAMTPDVRVTRYQEKTVTATLLATFNAGQLTERNERWAIGGAIKGVTYAYPLQDRRIIDYIFTVPDHLFLQKGLKRYLVRQATKPLFGQGLMDQYDINPKAEPRLLTYVTLLGTLQDAFGRPKMTPQDRLDNPWVDLERYNAARMSLEKSAIRPALDPITVAGVAVTLWELISRMRDLYPKASSRGLPEKMR